MLVEFFALKIRSKRFGHEDLKEFLVFLLLACFYWVENLMKLLSKKWYNSNATNFVDLKSSAFVGLDGYIYQFELVGDCSSGGGGGGCPLFFFFWTFSDAQFMAWEFQIILKALFMTSNIMFSPFLIHSHMCFQHSWNVWIQQTLVVYSVIFRVLIFLNAINVNFIEVFAFLLHHIKFVIQLLEFLLHHIKFSRITGNKQTLIGIKLDKIDAWCIKLTVASD